MCHCVSTFHKAGEREFPLEAISEGLRLNKISVGAYPRLHMSSGRLMINCPPPLHVWKLFVIIHKIKLDEVFYMT